MNGWKDNEHRLIPPFTSLRLFVQQSSALSSCDPLLPRLLLAPLESLPPCAGRREVTSSRRPSALKYPDDTWVGSNETPQTDASIKRLPSQWSTVGFTWKDWGDFEPWCGSLPRCVRVGATGVWALSTAREGSERGHSVCVHHRAETCRGGKPYLVRDLVACLLTSQSLYYFCYTTSLPAALPLMATLCAQCLGASEGREHETAVWTDKGLTRVAHVEC